MCKIQFGSIFSGKVEKTSKFIEKITFDLNNFEQEIIKLLSSKKIDIIRFADISGCDIKQRQGFPRAILFGVILSPEYLYTVSETPNYVGKMVENKQTQTDGFYLAEKKTDEMADFLAAYIQGKGFGAFSQSEKNLEKTGIYNPENQTTLLPHKTIARLAGLGWIGKNNLLVSPTFGSAISMCTVLTNAPLATTSLVPVNSLCENCTACIDACKPGAIKGTEWNVSTARDQMIDINECTTCLKCMTDCLFTQKFIKTRLRGKTKNIH